MSKLRSQLDQLANAFANGVLAAIRGASIEDLLGESRGAGGRARRAPGGGGGGQPDPLRGAKKRGRGGRLARRSAEDIQKVLAKVVSLVRGKKAGLRSEQIRKVLGLDVREVPRVLKEGLRTKKLRSKGQKRSTTYFAG
jgi:hypothetical protein